MLNSYVRAKLGDIALIYKFYEFKVTYVAGKTIQRQERNDITSQTIKVVNPDVIFSIFLRIERCYIVILYDVERMHNSYFLRLYWKGLLLNSSNRFRIVFWIGIETVFIYPWCSSLAAFFSSSSDMFHVFTISSENPVPDPSRFSVDIC